MKVFGRAVNSNNAEPPIMNFEVFWNIDDIIKSAICRKLQMVSNFQVGENDLFLWQDCKVPLLNSRPKLRTVSRRKIIRPSLGDVSSN